jgi:hypothetical protein
MWTGTPLIGRQTGSSKPAENRGRSASLAMNLIRKEEIRWLPKRDTSYIEHDIFGVAA